MNCAVFQSISSRSAPAARRSASDDSAAISSSSPCEYTTASASDHAFRRSRRGFVRMLQRPLQSAVHDQVGIPPDRRSKMRVLVEPQRKMPQRIGRVARLLQRSQHQVRNDALFRFARDFLHQPLIVLRRDPQLRRPARPRACRARGRARTSPAAQPSPAQARAHAAPRPPADANSSTPSE